MSKLNYRVEVAGFFFGKHEDVGATLSLTERQARFEVLQGNLKLTDNAAPAQDVAPARAPRRAGRVTETVGVKG